MNASAIRLHERDTVACALRDIAAGESVSIDGCTALTRDAIPLGHKLALVDIEPGQTIYKYGTVIGRATRAIAAGEHVHLHNLSGLARAGEGGAT